MVKHLYLMRHGETIINRAQRTQGWCDGVLTEKGIEVHVVGDCNEKAADINRAIEEGYLAANAI